MEADNAPSPSASRLSLSKDAADDLLAAFDIADDPESRAFLADLLTSGSVPAEEVELLAHGDDGAARQTARRGARQAPGASIAPSPSRSKHRRQKTEKGTDKAARILTRDDRRHEKACTRVLFAAGAKACVSPFFDGDASSSSDQDHGEGDKAGESSDESGDEPGDEPAAVYRRDFFVYTKKTVLGGQASPPAQPTTTPKATAASPGATKHAAAAHRTPSPAKKAQNEPSLLSLACFSPAASPSKSTPPSKRKRETTSYFFTPPSSRQAPNSRDHSSASSASAARALRGAVSGLPIPPLDAPFFGLVQEQLANDPFWLLVALVFLTRVAGRVSLPVFWRIKARFPTPQALAAAPPGELIEAMRHLGMASVRCAAIQRYARGWTAWPPRPGVCTTVRNYPPPPEAGEPARRLSCNAPQTATADSQWEIGHLTQGAYAVDSWRIFCRDTFLGRSRHWRGDVRRDAARRRRSGGSMDSDASSDASPDAMSAVLHAGGAFQPEWMRVLPRDKELRACLRWMWMREGWDWDPRTGERTVLSEELRCAVDEGRVEYDAYGQLQIVDRAVQPRTREELVVVL